MITESMKRAMTIGGFALMSVVAVAGWTRNPGTATPNQFNAPNAFSASAPGQYGVNTPVQQPLYDAQGRPVYGQPMNMAQNCTEPLSVQSAAYAPAGYAPVAASYSDAPATRYRTTSRPRVVRQVVAQDRDYVVRKKRSTGKSVAIVAGSAGAGAAIGALAGGGKGAGIGALSGGAAGFIYDRLTHNR